MLTKEELSHIAAATTILKHSNNKNIRRQLKDFFVPLSNGKTYQKILKKLLKKNK